MYSTVLPILIVAISVNVVIILCSNHSVNTYESVSDHSITCAPWHYINPSNGMCKCSVSKTSLIKCTDEGTLIRIGFCTTYTEGEGVSMARCPYLKMKTLRHAYTIARNDPLYIILPDNISELNDYMCGPMNRKGFLCSECIDGFSPSFTSPDYMACSNCTASRYYGVPFFVLTEIVPTTLFYLMFVLFQVNVTTSPMTCYIFYSQIMMLIATPSGKGLFQVYNTYFFQNNFDLATYTLYGLWNLDFLRYSLPPFCVSSRLNHTNITILGCVSVFYPLCLILLTITFVKLYDHNFKAVVCLWRPFHKCFTRIRRGWNTKSDIINVFATFLLISYNKLIYSIVNITESTRVYSMNNDSEIVCTGVFPYTDLNIFSSNNSKYHVLFITLAGLALIVILLPVLFLVCYPIRLFRRFLSKLRLDCVFVNIFVEKFYSCYKDGLHGSRDMRSFAGFYFLLQYMLRLVVFLAHRLNFFSSRLFCTIISQNLVCAAVLISLTRPYKRMYMTVLGTLLLCLLAAIIHLLSTDNMIPTQGMITSVVILIPAIVFWICIIFVVARRLTKLCITTWRRRGIVQEVTRYGTT